MEEKNKVSVKIYGQEYTIAGNTPRDHIIKVADYVDTKMHEIAKILPAGSISSLAVLSAVNVTDDYFSALERLSSLKTKNDQLEKDSQHYVQLWDEAKKSFLQYKEDAQASIEQRDELQRLFNQKTVDLDKITTAYKEIEEKYNVIISNNEGLTSSALKELEEKFKDMESGFFDLQMENVKLKGEIDRYKKL